jgi:hypothetical protein
VINCRSQGDDWILQVWPTDPASVPAWVKTLEHPETI